MRRLRVVFLKQEEGEGSQVEERKTTDGCEVGKKNTLAERNLGDFCRFHSVASASKQR